MADKVLIIDKGKISQYGSPKEVVHQPKNNFVEEFILRQLKIKKDNIYNLFGENYV